MFNRTTHSLIIGAALTLMVTAAHAQRRATVYPTSAEQDITVTISGAGFNPSIKVWLKGRLVPSRYISPRKILATIPPGARSGHFQLRGRGINITVQPRFTVVRKDQPTKRPRPGGVRINPGNTPGGQPGSKPGGRRPGRQPGTKPGRQPGTKPGRRPGRQPGTKPGRQPGAKPGAGPSGRRTVARVSPSSAYPGTTVTITGAGFHRNVQLWLAGRRIGVRYISPYKLTAQIPQRGARSGNFQIRGRGLNITVQPRFTVLNRARPPVGNPRTGSPRANNPRNPRARTGGVVKDPRAPYRDPKRRPVARRFSPSAGPIGTMVTIEGFNFDASTMVFLAGRRVGARVLSANKIVLKVARGARTGYFELRKGSYRHTVRPQFVVTAGTPRRWSGRNPGRTNPGRTNPGVTNPGRTNPPRRGTEPGRRNPPRRGTTPGRDPLTRAPAPPARVTTRPGAPVVRRRRRRPTRHGAQWAVRKPPRVTNFLPRRGRPGTMVTIQGANFDASTHVRFNGRRLRRIRWTPNSLVVQIPARVTSDYLLVSKAGFRALIVEPQFLVTIRPRITKFYPARGDVGSQVTIRGANFLPDDTVLIGGLPAQVLSCESRRIIIRVPPRARTGLLSIRRRGALAARSRRAFQVSMPGPIVHSFAPLVGATGTVVTISGANFSPADRVYLGRRPLVVRGRSETSISVVIPRRARNARFRIKGPYGRRAVSPERFSVRRPPRIVRFLPRQGTHGSQVRVFGFGFLPGDRVLLGNAELTVQSVTDGLIVAEIPGGARSGRISVERDGARFASRFAYRVISAPQVIDIQPKSGPVGTLVTIRGAHFRPRASVLLAGRRLRGVKQRGNVLYVRIPPGGKTGRFTVITPAGSTQSADTFIINAFAVVTSFHPRRAMPGQEVCLQGRQLHSGLRVWLGRIPLAVTRVTGNQACVRLPPGARRARFSVETYGRRIRVPGAIVVYEPPPEISFKISPTRARRGQDVSLIVRPPRHNVSVFFNGRLLPKRTVRGGMIHIVTIPGDARSGYFELDYNGRRYRARRKLIVR